MSFLFGKSEPTLCDFCEERPRYGGFPFCGRTCASKAPRCNFPYCPDKGLRYYRGYCCNSHLKQHGFCNKCRKVPRDPGKGELCASCFEWVEQSKTRLVELKADDPFGPTVEEWFKKQWHTYSKGPAVPTVHRVFEIKLDRNSAEKRDKFHQRIVASGNPEYITTLYSSQCICSLGSPSRREGLELCKLKSCGICVPLRSGFTKFEFDVEKTGSLGPGIYLTTDPTWADKFAISTTDSPFRVVLVCGVMKTKQSNYNLTDRRVFVSEPPAVTPEYLICFIPPNIQ